MTAARTDIDPIEKATMGKVILRLVPFLMICYFFALLDRVNVGFAALQMNKDLGLTPAMFGFGASLFFVSYFLVEVPSNLALQKFGARRWIARIMITWGLVTACMAFVVGPYSLYTMRFILGAAEAGFFPGAILYLTYWLPSEYRARILATFTVSIPLATFLGSPLSVGLLELDGALGLRGWQWLFILEGLPTVFLGLACLFVLTDRPEGATWLTNEQRNWLTGRMAADAAARKPVGHLSLWQLATNKYFLVMALVCSGASATGSVLSVWQPQLLKSFGLSNLQTGFVNAIPYGIATVLMVLWGRHSDKSGERRWHTAIPLLLAAGGFTALGLTGTAVAPTIVMVTFCLVGAYAFKGPFWALSASWLSTSTLAAGLAGINAISNLIGGGLMVNVVGLVKQSTGSFVLGMLPLALLCAVAATCVLVLGRNVARAADLMAVKS
ncbi:MFS transporter [Bradyrhizobium guangzhouense]|uniref:Putative tartrate transporter n=1 Tax=Bradyrhizobium guangzhouense TaxID=1325095 RepID=A0AAE5X4R6_9BRAD|nr:MFS transporter [Bradyrhizobium guangzhouense]QAU48877.1 MFS transporter [Bradyrhizobium guangzhouense]RXH09268.1 MFS transporter [Bradyrhizobium guangzhouense]